MYLDEYRLEAKKFAQYEDPMYPIASLMVEAAELGDLFIKPWLRGDQGDPDPKEILSEAGDVLWNLANVLSDAGITLDEVAEYNIKKLNRRHENGTIKGSGNR